MPRGPNGEWRPADVVGCAVHVMKIATGEIEEALPEPTPLRPDVSMAASEPQGPVRKRPRGRPSS